MKPVKITCRSFSLKNHRSSTVTRLWFYLKNGRRWSNKTAHIWFNKLHLKYETRNLFYFYIKIQRNFFPNPILPYRVSFNESLETFETHRVKLRKTSKDLYARFNATL